MATITIPRRRVIATRAMITRPFVTQNLVRRVAQREEQRQARARATLRARNVVTSGLLGAEVKFLDTGNTAFALAAPTDASGGEIQPTSGVTDCLSAPAQGDGAQARDGQRISILSMLVQGVCLLTGQATLDALNAEILPTVYVALVLDKQTNGATIVSENVFSNGPGVATMAAQPFRNMQNAKRFQVLRVKRITPKDFMTAAANNAAGTTISSFACHVPFTLSKKWRQGLKVMFSNTGTAANVSTVIDNSLHLIGFCSSTTMAPTITFAGRMRFVG